MYRKNTNILITDNNVCTYKLHYNTVIIETLFFNTYEQPMDNFELSSQVFLQLKTFYEHKPKNTKRLQKFQISINIAITYFESYIFFIIGMRI